MAHHKHGKRKNARAGCLMCKCWKVNGYGKNGPGWEKFSDHKRRQSAQREIRDHSA